MVTTIEVLGLEHIELTVNKLERSIRFYHKVLTALGFTRLEKSGFIGWSNAYMTIGLRPAAAGEEGTSYSRYRAGLHHIALKARRREDVVRFHEFLLREGVTVLDAPAEYPQYGPNYYAVFFADPDGMKFELCHFPWGYWRRVQTIGSDSRPRHLADDKV